MPSGNLCNKVNPKTNNKISLHPHRVGSSKRKCMTTTQLVEFLNKSQRDPRLNEILYPYVDPKRAKEVIQEYEPNKFNVQKGQLSVDGFLK